MKKNIFLMLLVIMSIPSFVFAKIEITEVMYDVSGTDTGREWIEIYNTGSETVTFSDIKILENKVNHKIEPTDAQTSLAPLSYAVVADNVEKFLLDYPHFTGILLDSAFSLLNTGEPLGIVYKDIVEEEIAYDVSEGANGDGNSLHKDVSNWVVRAPTPGAGMSSEAIIPETSKDTATTENKTQETSNTSVTASSHYSQVALSSLPETKLKIDAGRERTVTINTPLYFEGRMTANGKDVEKGKYQWSFGDGFGDRGMKAVHMYRFPGEYNVVVNGLYEKTKAVSRTKVKVVEPTLVINEVNSAQGFVQITNETAQEINIGDWEIKNTRDKYVFPQDTIMSPKASLKFPFTFDGNFSDEVILSYPNGDEMSRFSTSLLSPSLEEIQDTLKIVSREIQLLS